MFSLVTALVSPHVIDVLQAKKDTLVSTLQDNAHVLCLQPSTHVCMLQGEWENVKKAYAILEELYLRVQAERAVGERLKGDGGSGVPAGTTHRFWPPFVNSGEEAGERPKKHHVYVYPQSAVIHRSGSAQNKEDGEGDGEGDPQDDTLPEDEQPPEINRVDSYRPDTEDAEYRVRDGSNDAISLSSDTNDPLSRDARGSLDAPPTLVPERQVAPPGDLEVISDDGDGDSHDGEVESDSPQHTADLYSRSQSAVTRSYLEGQRSQSANGQSLLNVSVAGNATDLSKLTQSYLSSLSSLPQLSPQSKDALGPVRLPPASFLLQGPSSAAASSFFNYSALYNQHLSALQNMPLKQEPGASLSAANLDLHKAQATNDGSVKAEASSYEGRDSNLPELKCSHCDKTYRSEARMKEHIKTHDKNYVPVFHSCPKCGKSFTYRHNMIVHLRRFHFGWQPAKRHICRLCGMRFQKPYMLRDHEQRAHLKPPEENSSYRCTQCDAIFDNKHALAGHCSKNHNVNIDEASLGINPGQSETMSIDAEGFVPVQQEVGPSTATGDT